MRVSWLVVWISVVLWLFNWLAVVYINVGQFVASLDDMATEPIQLGVCLVGYNWLGGSFHDCYFVG